MAKAMMLFAVVALATGPVSAQVYKCTGPNGTTIFADAPCAVGAKPIVVRPAAGAGSGVEDVPAEEGGTKTSAEENRSRLSERADLAVRRRILSNDIDRKEAEIKSKTREMEEKLEALRQKKRFARNNLAGATWEQSISEEMSAVTASYTTQLEGMREEVARLRLEREKLGQ